MISFNLHSNTKSTKQPKFDRSIGADNYRQCDRATICKFQQIIERESDCDYDALRSALRKAQDRNFVVTLTNLRAAYNDSLYSSAQFATMGR